MTTEPVGPQSEDLTVTELDGCINVYNPVTQRAVLLNETATAIWHLIDGTRGIEAITRALAVRYDVSAADIGPEVATTVAELEREALLAPSAASPVHAPDFYVD
jgi:hypothetical protein